MTAFALTEFFPGMGTLCAPFSRGLSLSGAVKVAGVVELDGRYLRLFSDQHPEASTMIGSVTGYAPEETSFPSGNAANIFLAGIPCTGASSAGISKNGLSCAEQHPDVGHLFLPTLHHISMHLPEGIVFENVPNYRTTFSADAIRAHLRALGYHFTEYLVNPHTEFNTATARVRWVLVASRLGRFVWNYTPVQFTGTIEHLLDPITAQDTADEFTPAQVAAHTKYCDRKASEGCGFSRRILTRDSLVCPTIPKSYGKIQPTGVFVSSGTSAGTYRLLRPSEIARIHGFDDKFISAIARLPKTTAYEILGQGVVARPFEALGQAFGQWIASTRVPELAAA
jgi:DNA (cytosine-5)-methyltransferase 1